MDDRYALSRCKCGGIAVYATVNEDPSTSIYVFCERCGLMTPKKTAGLEYSAKEEVAKIWNAGETMWPRWVKGYKYSIDDQVTHTAKGQTQAEHWINEKDGNANEPGLEGSSWRLIGFASGPNDFLVADDISIK